MKHLRIIQTGFFLYCTNSAFIITTALNYAIWSGYMLQVKFDVRLNFFNVGWFSIFFFLLNQGSETKKTENQPRLKYLTRNQIWLVTSQAQPPPQALRFSHGRASERETSDWWWTARDHGKATDGKRSACQILCRFLGTAQFLVFLSLGSDQF